ncbi:MAG: hypothetical protein WAT39_02200 [Planctomycetota bacterium]
MKVRLPVVCVCLLGCLPWCMVSACSKTSSRTTTTALGAATIGPDGGVIAIDSGAQAGLRLTIPPGAVAEPTLFAVLDAALVLEPAAPVSLVPPISRPVVFEPRELRLAELATLRLPYSIANVTATSPGNVRVRQQRNGNVIDHEPQAIDARDGWIEVPVRTLSQFQVVRGPVAENVASYWQSVDTQVALADGRTFAVESVPAASPFAAPAGVRWRLTGPDEEDLLYFDGIDLLGRESIREDWREQWNDRYPVWTNITQAPPASGATFTTRVSRPIAALPIGGQITVYGVWSWAEPRTVAGQRLLDVARLRITLAWQRADLGVGQREYVFWFAPGIGLLAFSKDGVTWDRLAF